jgi:hypothetical protein
MDEMNENVVFTAPIFTKFGHSVEFCGGLMYANLMKSVGKYGQNFIYARQ